MTQHPIAIRGRLVTSDAAVDDGAIVFDGDRLAFVGPASDVPLALRAAVDAAPPPGDATVLPGLVDLHNHGGGGVGFPDIEEAEVARTAVAEHLAHGTTALLASLVTAPAHVLVARSAALAPLVGEGTVVGIHVEGPFVSPQRRGAQDARHMVAGRAELVRELADAAQGHLSTMTLAPEVPGADAVVDELVAAGAVPSFGHTDASYDQTARAVARANAASVRPTATHLFNAMRPLHHRDPGPVGACLAAAARGELVVELVADGVHVADETAVAVFDLLGADAIALVTDAMAATGMADGAYRLGGLDVEVAEGTARLRTGGAIAGGTTHLLDVVRRVVGAGIGLVDAVRAASATPADVLGRTDLGRLEAGARADAVVVGPGLEPRAVYQAGRRVAP